MSNNPDPEVPSTQSDATTAGQVSEAGVPAAEITPPQSAHVIGDAATVPPAPSVGPPALGPGNVAFAPPMPLANAISQEDRTLAMVCHLLGILTGFIGPLVLWLVKKDSSAFVDHHGREALNFQLTILIVMLFLGISAMILIFIFIGFLLFPVMAIVGILALVAEIIAAVAAQNGEWHRYPVCFRFV